MSEESTAPVQQMETVRLERENGRFSLSLSDGTPVAYVAKAELVVLREEATLRVTVLPLDLGAFTDPLPAGPRNVEVSLPVFVELVRGEGEAMEDKILREVVRGTASSERLSRHLGA